MPLLNGFTIRIRPFIAFILDSHVAVLCLMNDCDLPSATLSTTASSSERYFLAEHLRVQRLTVTLSWISMVRRHCVLTGGPSRGKCSRMVEPRFHSPE